MNARNGNFELPLVIPQRRSPRMFALTSAAHAGALICVLCSAPPMLIRIASVLCMACSYAWQLRRYLRNPRSRLQLSARGEWRMLRDDGSVEHLRLLTGAYVQPWLIVLRFSGVSGRRVLLLARDNTDADVLRRLSVWLRFGKP